MLDLSSLNQASEQLSKSQNQKSNQLSEDALSYLMMSVDNSGAGSEPFDLTLLYHAANVAQKAIQTDAKNLLAHLVMVQVMMLMELDEGCQAYLDACKNIAPDNPFVATFEEQWAAYRLLKRAVEDQDDQLDAELDALHASVQKRLLDQSSMLFVQRALKSISLDPEDVTRLEGFAQELAQFTHELQHDIQALEASFEVQGFRRDLNFLLQHQRKLQGHLQLTQQFLLIQHTIAQAQANAGLLATQMAARELTKAAAEAQLEALLDEADRIADALDRYDAEGHSIALLQPPYQGLVDRITQVQDTLDEWA